MPESPEKNRDEENEYPDQEQTPACSSRISAVIPPSLNLISSDDDKQ